MMGEPRSQSRPEVRTPRGPLRPPRAVRPRRLLREAGRCRLSSAGGRVDVAFIPDRLLDDLAQPSVIGRTRVGGIDLDKPRTRNALAAVTALPAAPDGFTVADLADKVLTTADDPAIPSAKPPTTYPSSAATNSSPNPDVAAATTSPTRPPAPSPRSSCCANRSSDFSVVLWHACQRAKVVGCRSWSMATSSASRIRHALAAAAASSWL